MGRKSLSEKTSILKLNKFPFLVGSKNENRYLLSGLLKVFHSSRFSYGNDMKGLPNTFRVFRSEIKTLHELSSVEKGKAIERNRLVGTFMKINGN